MLLLISLAFRTQVLHAAEIRVAVASNFLPTINELKQDYEKSSGNTLLISAGSSGKLYAQIMHGAPFDIFLSADADRPARLVNSNNAVKTSRFTYALGRLVLWGNKKRYTGKDCKNVLANEDFTRLAIANPRTAPYGAATIEVLKDMKLWHKIRRGTARGENISQTFQFVRSGNADVGFIAFSQFKQISPTEGCWWVIPGNAHKPLVQDAVLLSRAKNQEAAMHFLAYLRSDNTQSHIQAAGYDTIKTREH